jgi:hypothetical protein
MHAIVWFRQMVSWSINNPTQLRDSMKSEFSLVDAEKAYKYYSCSHFFMCREDPELYANYKSLEIPRRQEIQWETESFHLLLGQLRDEFTPRASLWILHSNAAKLAESIKDCAVLQALYEVSVRILAEVPEADCIMCAESILARNDVSVRSSVIFLSFALNEAALGLGFLKLARDFANRYGRQDSERCEQALKRAETISAMLDT